MCGIVGYVGKGNAAPFLVEGLKKLEYRGYDSAGIALINDGKFVCKKRKGTVAEISDAADLCSGIGIGHTRWATHGAPSERNAHPHIYGRFAIVHNGILENYALLKEELESDGETFISETDSEVVAHLLEKFYCGNLLSALREVTEKLVGSYALAVLCLDQPDIIVCARKASPLLVGVKDGACLIASDIPAIAGEGVTAYLLGDGEFALLNAAEAKFYSPQLQPIRKNQLEYDPLVSSSDKGGYVHFMKKEMSEIPCSVRNSICDFATKLKFTDFYQVLCQTKYIHIVACGTAYHSGLAAKYAIERLARVPVEVTIASEVRYSNPVICSGTLAIAISQSGETADTLAAAKLFREKGVPLVAVTNVSYSSLTRIADFVLPTRAGNEIGVAATKSYNAQLTVLYSLAIALANAKGKSGKLLERLKRLPRLATATLEAAETVRSWTSHFVGARCVLFIGRGADYCAAVEGSLKLKEITYLPSEGYPAGELKHGTLALVDEHTPVVVLLTNKRLAAKTMNAVHEAAARGAKVFLITSIAEYLENEEVFASVLIPQCSEAFTPLLSVIPLQALAYYTAIACGNDPDKPRNLAKSVTVE